MTRRTVALAAVLLAAVGCGGKGDTGPQGPPGPPGPPASTPPADNLRYTIQSATVAEGAAPTVTFKVTDASGNPITLKSGNTLAFTPSFTLAKLGANGKWASLLTRATAGKPYYASQADQNAGKQTPPAIPTGASQAISQASSADRITGGDGGVYTYTFSGPVTGVVPTATHRVGIYGNRVADGITMSDSNTLDFVPAGGTPTSHEVVNDAACNRCHTVLNAHGGARRGVKLCLTCHNPTSVDPESGNSVDLMVLVHKIHKGEQLANGFKIVGFGGNPPPAVLPFSAILDVSHIVMGPSHNTYFDLAQPAPPAPATPPIGDRGIVRECALCHQGAQADAFHTSLAAKNCNTCHDDVNPGDTALLGIPPGTNHGPQHGAVAVGGWPDNACASCHGATLPFAVERVHSVNYEPTRNLEFTPSSQNVLTITVDKVNNLVSGGSTPPDIEFTIKLNGNPYDVFSATQPSAGVDGKSLGSLAFQVAGPITDYAGTLPSPSSALSGLASTGDVANPTPIASPARGGITVIDQTAGKYRFTYPAPLAAGKTGIYTVAYEAFYRERKLGPGGEIISKPYAADPVFHDDPSTPADDRNVRFVDIATGADVTTVNGVKTERRKIVSNSKCNNCHEDLGFHGNRSRSGVDYCVTCHNPTLSNTTRARFQPSETGVVNSEITKPDGTTKLAPGSTTGFIVNSVSGNVFIHKIHSGASLSKQPYRLGAVRTATDHTPEQWAADPGSGGEDAFADFSDFNLPSPIGNCTTCHDPGSYDLPDTPGLLTMKRSVLSCATTVNDSTGAPWCSDRTVLGTIATPPIKAVCTACHDTDATSAHADLNTVQPMTVNAVETCGTCHGAGREFEVVKMHPPVLTPSADLPP